MPPTKEDISLFRDNPWAIASYLADAFEKNDVDEILKALNTVMRAQNVMAIAKETGLRREALYRTFGGTTEPYLYRVMALLNALGVRLTVKAMPPRPIPPRPKLGRPRKPVTETARSKK